MGGLIFIRKIASNQCSVAYMCTLKASYYVLKSSELSSRADGLSHAKSSCMVKETCENDVLRLVSLIFLAISVGCVQE